METLSLYWDRALVPHRLTPPLSRIRLVNSRDRQVSVLMLHIHWWNPHCVRQCGAYTFDLRIQPFKRSVERLLNQGYISLHQVGLCCDAYGHTVGRHEMWVRYTNDSCCSPHSVYVDPAFMSWCRHNNVWRYHGIEKLSALPTPHESTGGFRHKGVVMHSVHVYFVGSLNEQSSCRYDAWTPMWRHCHQLHFFYLNDDIRISANYILFTSTSEIFHEIH